VEKLFYSSVHILSLSYRNSVYKYSLQNKRKPGVMVHTYNSSYSGGKGMRIVSLRLVRAKLASPSLKKKKSKPKTNKRARRCDSNDMPSMCRGLGSIPSTGK
jgi:hypothetical protein